MKSNTTSLAVSALALVMAAQAGAQTVINIDQYNGRHLINPNVYGINYLMTDGYTPISSAMIADLKTPLVRVGGDLMSTYNIAQDADNHDFSYYFESLPEGNGAAGWLLDNEFSAAKSAGASAMITVPMLGYVANLGPNRSMTSSFSVKKYGAQTAHDGDAGNGILLSGKAITNNNPLDACNLLSASTDSSAIVTHMTTKWGMAGKGGVQYYIMDNEPGSWYGTHRDIHPVGDTMNEIYNDYVTYGTKVRQNDPNAQIVGPEETNWASYFYSGSDIQWANAHGWNPANFPDRKAHSGSDYIPWLLKSLNAYQKSTGTKLLDVLSLHWYPQGPEYSNDDSAATQALRNQTTRSLWDPTYTDPDLSSIEGSSVVPNLANQLNSWIKEYDPGLQKGITEYSWGDDANMNGATAEADCLGIFGRYGYDMAAKWGVPSSSTPTYQVMKMFRNYDGLGNGFGDVSLTADSPTPNTLSTYAALRSSDGAMTVMIVNKATASNTVDLYTRGWSPQQVGGTPPRDTYSAYQVSSANPSTITNLGRKPLVANSNYFKCAYTVPAQSVTLLVFTGTEPGIYSDQIDYPQYDFDEQSTSGFALSQGEMSLGMGLQTTGSDSYDGLQCLEAIIPPNQSPSSPNAKNYQITAPYPAIAPGQTAVFAIKLSGNAMTARPMCTVGGKVFYGQLVTTMGQWGQYSLAIPTGLGPVQNFGVLVNQPYSSAAVGGFVYIDDIAWTH